jgi:hypothetical protein
MLLVFCSIFQNTIRACNLVDYIIIFVFIIKISLLILFLRERFDDDQNVNEKTERQNGGKS